MMKFPSNTAAVFTGTITMPLFVFITQYMQAHFSHSSYLGFSLFIWSLIGFVFPFSISTFDFRYYKNTYGSFWKIFKPEVTKEDFRKSLIPTWKRMFLWFVSAVASILFLTLFGIFKM